jgi:hypothetical protein
MNLDRTRKPRVASFRYRGVSSSEVAYDSLSEVKWRNLETSEQNSFLRQSKNTQQPTQQPIVFLRNTIEPACNLELMIVETDQMQRIYLFRHFGTHP